MTMYIGHASISEYNTVNGNKGDQTKKEVCVRTYYDNKWQYILRPISYDIAERSARACEVMCANDCIGYSQADRNSLEKELQALNFNYAYLKNPCNTDCSAFMTVCAEIGAGALFPHTTVSGGAKNAPTTRTMRKVFVNTGYYKALKFTKKEDLRRGDILLKEGSHTVMSLTTFGASNNSSPKKSVHEVALEVIDGKWGVYPNRKKRLEAAGYNYKEVQNEVNRICKSK